MVAQRTLNLSEFFWNADETLVSSVKRMSPPDVNIATGIKHGSLLLPEIQDDAELSLLMGISHSAVLHFKASCEKISHPERQPWRLNSSLKAMIILSEQQEKLSLLKYCLLIGLRRLFMCESMNFINNLEI
jgi:hypothetical protein